MDTSDLTPEDVRTLTLKHIPSNPKPTVRWMQNADDWLNAHFEYAWERFNPEVNYVFDHWRTCIPPIIRRLEGYEEGNIPIWDDCDAKSMSMVDLAVLAGIPQEDCYLVLCMMNQNQENAYPFDHMIAVVKIEGAYYVTGDTGRFGVYPVHECTYPFYAIHALPLLSNNWVNYNGQFTTGF